MQPAHPLKTLTLPQFSLTPGALWNYRTLHASANAKRIVSPSQVSTFSTTSSSAVGASSAPVSSFRVMFRSRVPSISPPAASAHRTVHVVPPLLQIASDLASSAQAVEPAAKSFFKDPKSFYLRIWDRWRHSPDGADFPYAEQRPVLHQIKKIIEDRVQPLDAVTRKRLLDDIERIDRADIPYRKLVRFVDDWVTAVHNLEAEFPVPPGRLYGSLVPDNVHAKGERGPMPFVYFTDVDQHPEILDMMRAYSLGGRMIFVRLISKTDKPHRLTPLQHAVNDATRGPDPSDRPQTDAPFAMFDLLDMQVYEFLSAAIADLQRTDAILAESVTEFLWKLLYAKQVPYSSLLMHTPSKDFRRAGAFWSREMLQALFQGILTQLENFDRPLGTNAEILRSHIREAIKGHELRCDPIELPKDQFRELMTFDQPVSLGS